METIKRTPIRVNPLLRHPNEMRHDLGETWGFQLDPRDEGVARRWYERPYFSAQIKVPGCWQGQGFGDDRPVRIWDFNVEARTLRAAYTGTGWYGMVFGLPGGWERRRVWLNFGGAYPSAEVWLNGARLGEHCAPFVPFAFEASAALAPGADNLLAVRVHEAGRELGLAYGWQGPWSGLYRGVELTATGACYLEQVHLLPDLEAQALRVRVWVGGVERAAGPLSLAITVRSPEAGDAPVTVEVPVAASPADLAISIPSPHPWSPDTPNLYRVDVALLAGGEVQDAQSERTGFLKLSTEGKHFLINGEPYYLRGSGEFCICPETGSPDTDRTRWRRKLAALRAYGYNYVRCQSVVPAPEYYDVADEVGLLVQTEMGTLGAWGSSNPFHVYQWPQPTPDYRSLLKWQWDQVVMRDANHPSASLYCMSNEWGKSAPYPRTAWQCYHDTRAIKPTAFVIWTDGGYNLDMPGDFINAEAELDDQTDKPLVQHEFRWWSSLPDVRTLPKYTGAVRPYGVERLLETAAQHGLTHTLAQAAANSQRLQFLEMKAKMEGCRRDNPRLAGICHFNATDSGASPQGVLDEFYERKYADVACWQQTNGDTVLLSDLKFDDRVYTAGERLRVGLSVSDFSHPAFRRPAVEWRLTAGGRTLDAGRLDYEHRPYGTCVAGGIETVLPAVERPLALRLEAALREDGRTVDNAWDLWLLPPAAPLPAGLAIYGPARYTWLKDLGGLSEVGPDALSSAGDSVRAVLTERLDATVAQFAAEGGRVILAAAEGLVRPMRSTFGYPHHYFFTPPANYPTYEDGQDGTIIQNHPLLGDFPHEGFADWQFFRMVAGAPPLDLEPLGLNAGDPIIRMIHSYQVYRPLGYLVECGLGAGSLILCSLDLNPAWPEARYLLACLCRHAVYGTPQPSTVLTGADVARLLAVSDLP